MPPTRGLDFTAFFSPSESDRKKLLLCVLLQSTCTGSEWASRYVYPLLVGAASDEQQRKKRQFYCFCMYLVCLCVCTHMHKCECVRVSASESQRLEMEALFRTWKFEDDLIGQDSDPFLTFALQTLQETLFVYLCSLSNSVYVPASKAFRFLQVHFLIISRPVFPYQRICPQHVLC